MKKTMLTLLAGIFLSLPNASFCQKNGGWEVGAVCQPFLYWKYNKSDGNNRPQSYVDSPNKFNGVAVGISVERLLSDKFGIGGELTFSKQRQDVNTLVTPYINMDGSESYYYANGSFTKLDYLKMPLFASYKIEIGYESGLFLKFIGGPQISYNTNYHSEYKQYGFDPFEKKVLYDKITDSHVITPKHFYQDFVNVGDGTHQINEFETNRLYKRFELGVQTGASLQKKIKDIYNIRIGIRYELGLTNIENTKDFSNISYLTHVGISGYLGSDRSATNNRRLVLDIGVSRIIE